MLDYDPKILLAFGETFGDNGEEFFKWLIDNGYPELAALSSCIRGSDNAHDWLMKNKFTHFAALEGAIDQKPEAFKWLKKHNFDLLFVFANAVHDKPEAVRWLKDNDLEMFLHLAIKIRKYGENQEFNYHKMPF